MFVTDTHDRQKHNFGINFNALKQIYDSFTMLHFEIRTRSSNNYNWYILKQGHSKYDQQHMLGNFR